MTSEIREVKETTEDSKKTILKNVIKWVILGGLLAFAYFKNRDFMESAFDEVRKTPTRVILICLALANIYFVAEGMVISRMTSTNEVKLSVFQGIYCTYMCAFYRLATLGSGNGIAQVYYYKTKGIPIPEGTGMSVVQYTFQKITIGVFGVVSFFALLVVDDGDIRKYSGYMALGVLVITFICTFLFVITVSKTISDLVMKLGRFLVKNSEKLNKQLDKAQEAIDNLQRQGRITWKNKKVFIQVVLLDVVKLSCWYLIPGVIFAQSYDVDVFFCMALMAVCNMLGCVMVAPSGVGTLDFVFAVFFGTIISKKKTVAAALVIYRLFTWMIPFVIGFFPAILLKKNSRRRRV